MPYRTTAPLVSFFIRMYRGAVLSLSTLRKMTIQELAEQRRLRTEVIFANAPTLRKSPLLHILSVAMDKQNDELMKWGLGGIKWHETRQRDEFAIQNMQELEIYYAWSNDIVIESSDDFPVGFWQEDDDIRELLENLASIIYYYYYNDDHDFYSLCRQ